MRAEQEPYARYLYDIVKPMFDDELRAVSQWDIDEASRNETWYT